MIFLPTDYNDSENLQEREVDLNQRRLFFSNVQIAKLGMIYLLHGAFIILILDISEIQKSFRDFELR